MKGLIQISSYRIGMGMLRVSTGNGVATEVTCITHGHELRGNCWGNEGYQVEGGKRGKIGTTVIA